jgi:glucose-6-phosphate isomerase
LKSEELKKEFQNYDNEILQSFTSKYQEKIRGIKKNIKIKNKKKVIIGLGGSSSGAKAMSFFLNDEIIYFDNLDLEYFLNFFKKNKIEDYIFFIISKSGDTFETLALLDLLIQEGHKIQNYNVFDSMVVITEDKNSLLKEFANKNKIQFVEHNPDIGGRFSILSETGMLPFIDLDIKVEDGSEKYLKFLGEESNTSPTLNSAIITTCIEKYNLSMYCNLIYNYRLKHFSYWFHQLHAESLGKDGKGLTPLTSICPKDHHSMMQLYLDGPKNKIFNIFSPADEEHYNNFKIDEFKNIKSYSPSGLLNKQFTSVIEVFREQGIPHRIINLKDHKNPLNLIELFSYFLLETILLGKILNINPYGQPSVQLIKEKIFKN